MTNMKRFFPIFLVCFSLFFPSLAFSKVWQWKDDEGRIHLTPVYDDIPMGYRSQAKEILSEEEKIQDRRTRTRRKPRKDPKKEEPQFRIMYQWENENGVLQTTDDISMIPSQFRDKTREIKIPFDKKAKARERRNKFTRYRTPPPTDTTKKKVVDRFGHDKRWWQARKKSLKDQMANKQAQLEEVEEQRVEARRFNRHTDERTHLKTINNLKQEIADLNRSIKVDLPEEARQAGAFPGWLRD